MPPKGWRKTTDDLEPTAEAPSVITGVLAGDVYQTCERLVAVILEKTEHYAIVAYSPSMAQAEVTPWLTMKQQAKRINPEVCAHHRQVGNWALIGNIEGAWKK